MGNDDTHISQRWLYDIHEVLFVDMGLNIKQSNRYGFEFMTKDPHTNPFANEELSNIGFISFQSNYSHMLYWKSGHSLINQILEGTEQEPNGFNKTKDPINENIVIPYKDPVDKFLSAYFTSHDFKEQSGDKSSDLYNATRHITQGNVKELTEVCYNRLETFVDRCLSNGDATGMGKQIWSSQWRFDRSGHPEPRLLFDVHFYPVHLLLYQALRNRTDRFKLFGLNLDFGTESFIYSDIKRSNYISNQRKDMLLNRQSANNNFIKMICQKWKCANSIKVNQLIQMYLLNDYKLIEVLDKNTLIGGY